MSKTMRAWVVSANGDPVDVLTLAERALPQPGPGEVRVRVAAAGLGLPDVLMCRGEYLFTPSLPFVPGQEVVGVVDACGEGSALAPGARVMGVTSFYSGHGGFAEYCTAPDFSLYPVPDSMTDAEAAGFTIPYHTAWVGLQLRAQIQPGEVLLVHGAAGSSGAAAIKLGRALGATVIAVAGGAEKSAYCSAAGADQVLDHRECDFVAQVNTYTDGRGADVVFDPVGGEVLEKSVACTASGGRLLAVGFASGRWGKPDTGEMVARNCAALGVYVGAYGHDEIMPCHLALCEMFEQGKISATPERLLDFEVLPGGLSDLASRSTPGKSVLLAS